MVVCFYFCRMRIYHGPQIKVESKNATKGDTDDVVASDINVRNECLPSTSDRDTYSIVKVKCNTIVCL